MEQHLTGTALLSVLYEDEYCFVLNKPSGIHSVSLPNDSKDTLAARLLMISAQFGEASEKPGDAGLVQRLDLETSGVLLGAKSREVWLALHAALSAGEIEKSYLALVEGKFPRELAVNNYIGTSNRRAKKVKVFPEKPRDKDRALPARSRFTLVRYFPEFDASLVKVVAPTARRHQVRAHAGSSGHALLGDALYGSARSTAEIEEGAPTFLLHAERIMFAHPVSHKTVEVSAPHPVFLKIFSE